MLNVKNALMPIPGRDGEGQFGVQAHQKRHRKADEHGGGEHALEVHAGAGRRKNRRVDDHDVGHREKSCDAGEGFRLHESCNDMLKTMNPYERFLEGGNALKIISATPAKLRALLKGLTPAQLKKHVHRGKWSIHEIVLHLADCELMFCSRCRLIAFEDHPHLTPFDQDRWNEGKLREKESTRDALARFESLRKTQISLHKASSKEVLARTGVHPERGEVSVRETFETAAGHDVNHLRQIEGLRAAFKKKK